MLVWVDGSSDQCDERMYMSAKLTRREFLKKTGFSAVAFPLLRSENQTPDEPGTNPAGTEAGISDPFELVKVTEHRTICSMCASRCHLLCKVRQGKVIKIEGNPASPFNKGKICAKGHAAIQQLYDTDRLKYPLKRVGERGEGRWRRISWAEALDTIAVQIKKGLNNGGPESIGLFAKGPSSAYIRELFTDLNIPNINVSMDEQCESPRDMAYEHTFGFGAGRPERVDYRETGCIVLNGSHFGENVDVPQQIDLAEALENGAKLIVVDPRYSAIAAKADYHLMIRPGTDTALFLGWIHHLIETDLYDKSYVESYTRGFEELRHAVSGFSLDLIASLTGISVDTIKRTAEIMAAHAPATAIHPGRHTSWYGDDVQRNRARAILTAILGCWGRKGGLFLPSKIPGGDLLKPPYRTENTPSSAIFAKALQGTINVLGIWGQNPLHGYANPYRTSEALKRTGFIFVCDILPTEPCLYADIILPEAMFLERYDIIETWTDTNPAAISVRKPVVEAPYQCRDSYTIVKELSGRLGKVGNFVYGTAAERISAELKKIGFTLENLDELAGIATFPGSPYLEPLGSEIRQLQSRLPENLETVSVLPGQSVPGHTIIQQSDTLLPGKESPEELVAPKALFRENLADEKVPLPPVFFPTSSGKIELYSSALELKGFAPLPELEPVDPAPTGFARLLYGRSPVHTGSSTMNNSWLLHEFPEPVLWVNDKIAENLKIADNDNVFLENQDGVRSIQPIRVKVTPGIRWDCVFMVHGFGSRSMHLSRAFHRGISDSALMTRTAPDPIGGNRGLRVNFVRFVIKGKVMNIPALEKEVGLQGQTGIWSPREKTVPVNTSEKLNNSLSIDVETR